MSTKYRMAEQVLRMLTAGDPSAGSRWDIREIEILIEQACNSKLKVTHFQESMAAGETIPEGVKLAKYENVPVVKYGKYSRSVLPITPITLPRNMGIFHIGPMDDPFCGFIPLQTGQFGQVRTQGGMSDLLGQVGYESRESEIIYTKDISGDHPNGVMMLLAIMDISKYDDYTPLPISPDMELEIIGNVYQMLAPRPEPNKIVESVTTK